MPKIIESNGTPLSVSKISQHLRDIGLVVPIDTLTIDPDNARLHPERNMEAIKQSLSRFGQVHPVVARKATRIVISGNGRLAAARELGWTEIACTFVDLSDAEAAGFGLADNRTAELARWDMETVARLNRIIKASEGCSAIGWSDDEMKVLEAAGWEPPDISDLEGNSSTKGNQPVKSEIKFSAEQWKVVEGAITILRDRLLAEGKQDQSTAECLKTICIRWLGGIK